MILCDSCLTPGKPDNICGQHCECMDGILACRVGCIHCGPRATERLEAKLRVRDKRAARIAQAQEIEEFLEELRKA